MGKCVVQDHCRDKTLQKVWGSRSLIRLLCNNIDNCVDTFCHQLHKYTLSLYSVSDSFGSFLFLYALLLGITAEHYESLLLKLSFLCLEE